MNRITLFSIALLLSIAISCKCERERKDYSVVGNGQIMRCSQRQTEKCGLTLLDCEDGNEYRCLNNVILKKGNYPLTTSKSQGSI